jgi:ABC-type glycerol-3-phosphate transport system substrate-binding protein
MALLLLVVAMALAAVACGGDDDESSDTAGGAAANEDVSGSLSVAGIWAGQEQASFQAVIDSFNQAYPNVSVQYNSAGDNLPTVLQTAVQGGNPPDIAFIAQPGTIQGFADDDALQPIAFAEDAVVETSRAPTSRSAGTTRRSSRTPASRRPPPGTSSRRRPTPSRPRA